MRIYRVTNKSKKSWTFATPDAEQAEIHARNWGWIRAPSGHTVEDITDELWDESKTPELQDSLLQILQEERYQGEFKLVTERFPYHCTVEAMRGGRWNVKTDPIEIPAYSIASIIYPPRHEFI